jgi:y4mF family transcriptional regulator
METSNTVVWRSGVQLGAAVRAARERMGLTQAQLARRAAVGLKFLYELEAGKDTLRSDKVLDVLDVLGLELVVAPRGAGGAARGPAARTAVVGAREPRARYGAGAPSKRPQPDYIGMACTTAGVSLRKALTPDELVRSLLTGEPAPGKEAHFIVLLEEAPPELLRGLVAQVGAWAKPGAVARNVRKIAARIGVRLKAADWLKAA